MGTRKPVLTLCILPHPTPTPIFPLVFGLPTLLCLHPFLFFPWVAALFSQVCPFFPPALVCNVTVSVLLSLFVSPSLSFSLLPGLPFLLLASPGPIMCQAWC